MAEGIARHYAMGGLEVCSAGITPYPVDRRAVQVMHECGIDIADQTHKAVGSLPLERMDLIVTLCGWAQGQLPPLPPHVHRLHWDIPDPTRRVAGQGPEALAAYREVRDDLERRIRTLLDRVHRLIKPAIPPPLDTYQRAD